MFLNRALKSLGERKKKKKKNKTKLKRASCVQKIGALIFKQKQGKRKNKKQ